MRHAAIALTFFLFLTGIASAEDGIMAPDWTLISATGDAIRLSDEIRQQPTVLLFWATWQPASSIRKAAYLAPNWAAEIRKAIDQIHSESTR